MHVVLNGREEEVAAGSTLADLVAGLGRDPRAVAVERNGEIVPRSRYAATVLAAGDRLEVVHFVQGGGPSRRLSAGPRARLSFGDRVAILPGAVGR